MFYNETPKGSTFARLVLGISVKDGQLPLYSNLPLEFPLNAPRTLVGRSEAADILIDSIQQPSGISRSHFQISTNCPEAHTGWDPDEYPFVVQGCASTNAISVNDVEVPGTTQIPLTYGDRISICEFVFRLEAPHNWIPPLRAELAGQVELSQRMSLNTSATRVLAGEAADARRLSRRELAAVLKFQWAVGQRVEVKALEAGYRGAWFPAVVREVTAQQVLVEYTQFKQEDGSDETESVKTTYAVRHGPAKLNYSRVRPSPPTDTGLRYLDFPLPVEALYEGGWWEGTVSTRSSFQLVVVDFAPAPEGEGGTMQFSPDELRPSLVWTGTNVWRPRDPGQRGIQVLGGCHSCEKTVEERATAYPNQKRRKTKAITG